MSRSSSWSGDHSLGSDRAEVCPEAAPSPVDDLVPRYFETGPIAVSGDHSSTQVCKDILSILSIFFGEASLWYRAKLFSPDVSLFH